MKMSGRVEEGISRQARPRISLSPRKKPTLPRLALESPSLMRQKHRWLSTPPLHPLRTALSTSAHPPCCHLSRPVQTQTSHTSEAFQHPRLQRLSVSMSTLLHPTRLLDHLDVLVVYPPARVTEAVWVQVLWGQERASRGRFISATFSTLITWILVVVAGQRRAGSLEHA